MNCEDCGYREELSGSCHSKCVHDFGKSGKKIAIKLTQWSRKFPLNFDPIWIKSCEAFTKERDSELVIEFTPLEEMMGILG